MNGTTFSQFRKLLKSRNWKIVRESKRPVGSVGRLGARNKLIKGVSYFFVPLVYVPVVREMALQRIAYILERE